MEGPREGLQNYGFDILPFMHHLNLAAGEPVSPRTTSTPGPCFFGQRVDISV